MATEDPIKTFEEECLRHAQLETFDPAAFKPDKKVSENLCSFVLSLSLVYNDFKDLIFALKLLQQSKPENPYERNRIWGIYTALNGFLGRYLIGCTHELMKLIDENPKAVDDPFLKEVLKNIPREARKAWTTLVDVSRGENPKTELGKVLHRIRNKVAFHYDHKVIYQGYNRHFFDGNKVDERAYISRDEIMRQTRFFFADAAAQGVQRILFDENPQEFANKIVNVIRLANAAISSIVDGFIQKRGYAYRKDPE